ncbi:unnamed protein product, partial [Polarella glacialis]
MPTVPFDAVTIIPQTPPSTPQNDSCGDAGCRLLPFHPRKALPRTRPRRAWWRELLSWQAGSSGETSGMEAGVFPPIAVSTMSSSSSSRLWPKAPAAKGGSASLTSTSTSLRLAKAPKRPPSAHLKWATQVREQQGEWLKEHRFVKKGKPRRSQSPSQTRKDTGNAAFLPALTGTVVDWATCLRVSDEAVCAVREEQKGFNRRRQHAMEKLMDTQQKWRMSHAALDRRRRNQQVQHVDAGPDLAVAAPRLERSDSSYSFGMGSALSSPQGSSTSLAERPAGVRFEAEPTVAGASSPQLSDGTEMPVDEEETPVDEEESPWKRSPSGKALFRKSVSAVMAANKWSSVAAVIDLQAKRDEEAKNLVADQANLVSNVTEKIEEWRAQFDMEVLDQLATEFEAWEVSGRNRHTTCSNFKEVIGKALAWPHGIVMRELQVRKMIPESESDQMLAINSFSHLMDIVQSTYRLALQEDPAALWPELDYQQVEHAFRNHMSERTNLMPIASLFEAIEELGFEELVMTGVAEQRWLGAITKRALQDSSPRSPRSSVSGKRLQFDGGQLLCLDDFCRIATLSLHERVRDRRIELLGQERKVAQEAGFGLLEVEDLRELYRTFQKLKSRETAGLIGTVGKGVVDRLVYLFKGCAVQVLTLVELAQLRAIIKSVPGGLP